MTLLAPERNLRTNQPLGFFSIGPNARANICSLGDTSTGRSTCGEMMQAHDAGPIIKRIRNGCR